MSYKTEQAAIHRLERYMRVLPDDAECAKAYVLARMTGATWYVGQKVKASPKAKTVWTVIQVRTVSRAVATYTGPNHAQADMTMIDVLSPKGVWQHWNANRTWPSGPVIVEDAS